ncbi:unnamed protein product [Debaryomyces tyrocola]|nr:unnamed protein product [Debaryomyces tyrocola]
MQQQCKIDDILLHPYIGLYTK